LQALCLGLVEDKIAKVSTTGEKYQGFQLINLNYIFVVGKYISPQTK